MPKLKKLSGKEVITLFQRFGFEIVGASLVVAEPVFF